MAGGSLRPPRAALLRRAASGRRTSATARRTASTSPAARWSRATAAGTAARCSTEDVLVVERFTDLGRRWSDRTVHRPDGTRPACCGAPRPPTAGRPRAQRSLVARDHAKNDVVELVDDKQAVVLTLIRPIGAPKSSVEVRDSEGRDAGRIVQQNLRRNETTYAFLGPNGQLPRRPAGRELGRLGPADRRQPRPARSPRSPATGRAWTSTSSPRPDDYVVRISSRCTSRCARWSSPAR